MTTLSDRARQWLKCFETVFAAVVGRPPTRPSLHMALAVATYETGLGGGWVKREIYDDLVSFGWLSDDFEVWAAAVRSATNLGATQYKKPSDFGPGPWPAVSPDGNGFLYYDTNPDEKGVSHPYPMYFRAAFDGTEEEIASDYLRILFTINGRQKVLAEAEAGDIYGTSVTLYDTVYYRGFGANRDERIANHFRALSRAAVSIARIFVWPMPDGTALPPATLRRGDMGPSVDDLQQRLVVLGYYTGELDGVFGAKSERAVRAFQKDHGLTPDGIVGELTWTALRATNGVDAYATEPPPAPDTEPAAPSEPTTDMRLAAAILSLQRARTLIDSALATLGDSDAG